MNSEIDTVYPWDSRGLAEPQLKSGKFIGSAVARHVEGSYVTGSSSSAQQASLPDNSAENCVFGQHP